MHNIWLIREESVKKQGIHTHTTTTTTTTTTTIAVYSESHLKHQQCCGYKSEMLNSVAYKTITRLECG
jgi:hypothetical protein